MMVTSLPLTVWTVAVTRIMSFACSQAAGSIKVEPKTETVAGRSPSRPTIAIITSKSWTIVSLIMDPLVAMSCALMVSVAGSGYAGEVTHIRRAAAAGRENG